MFLCLPPHVCELLCMYGWHAGLVAIHQAEKFDSPNAWASAESSIIHGAEGPAWGRTFFTLALLIIHAAALTLTAGRPLRCWELLSNLGLIFGALQATWTCSITARRDPRNDEGMMGLFNLRSDLSDHYFWTLHHIPWLN